MRHSFTIMLTAVLAVACRGERTDSGAGAATIPAGVGATPGGPAIPLSNLAELPVSRVHRIDGSEADLPDINWVGGAEGGLAAIITMKDKQVRLYDPYGHLIAATGRPGSGPGEFQDPFQGGWRGDTLWVADDMLRRFTLIDFSGHITRLTPPLLEIKRRISGTEPAAEYRRLLPYALLPGDTMLVSALPPRDTLAQVLRVSPDGWIERVLLKEPHPMPGRVSFTWPDGQYGATAIPFYPLGHSQVSPYGSAIVRLDPVSSAEGTFRVTQVTASGDTIYSHTYQLEPIRIPKKVIDSAVMEKLRRARTSIQKNVVRTKLPGVMPAVYPVYGLPVLDERDCTWLRMQPYSGQNEWVRLDRKGNPQGRVTLPARHQVTAAHGHHLWAIETDVDDVESLVRFLVKPCTD